MHSKFFSKRMKGRDHFRDIDLDVRIILKWDLNRVRICGLDLACSAQRPVVGSCEHGNELSGSIIVTSCVTFSF